MSAPEKRTRTLIKVCGVRSIAEARSILDQGADAIGVVVAPGSPRQVDPDTACSIATACGPRTVLVVRGTDPDWADLSRSWPGPVQIHDPSGLPARRFVVAISAGGALPSGAWMDAASGFLLDAHQAGSGQPWDWRSAPSTPAHLPRILAGGLTPANVASAIDATEPWAVDVSSGVERSRGIKDHNLVAEFIQAVRACDLAAGRDAEPLPPGFSGLA